MFKTLNFGSLIQFKDLFRKTTFELMLSVCSHNMLFHMLKQLGIENSIGPLMQSAIGPRGVRRNCQSLKLEQTRKILCKIHRIYVKSSQIMLFSLP